LVGNRELEATGLAKEAAASGHGITSLSAFIQDLFGLKHRAKHADLVRSSI
jgi:hypothetical protein